MVSGSLLLYAADQRSIAAFASSAGPATATAGDINIRAMKTTCAILAIFLSLSNRPRTNRVGSFPGLGPRNRDVRFASINGHHQLDLTRPKSANRRHHSITWSARSRNELAIVSPIVFAVLRLMTSSNLVGCSTGKSAGR